MASTQIKDGFDGGSDNQLKVNSDGSINVNSTGSGGNASVGTNGTTAPTSSTQVAGVDSSGNLEALKVDDQGNLLVNSTGVITGVVTSNEAGLTAFQTSQYAIGTSSVQLTPTPLNNRSSISITIEASPNIPVYIGNSSSVTTTSGYPLYDGSTLQLDLTPSGQVWAISTTAGQVAACLEIA